MPDVSCLSYAALMHAGVDSFPRCLMLLSCMQVWNPSFDVTPAALIAGIITEKGLIPRSGDTFEVRLGVFWFLCGAMGEQS